ncbi:ABC transporter ATP-binding protein [Candidatus Pacearchaeota archaeon]|nr:ABC transporter ATP-binding protein [Candidatus Pacearchaeota archaeon]
MQNVIIKLENVGKYYYMGEEGENVVKALDGISIDVEKGDFVAIMGPSGSGKSTGMNLVGSLDLPSFGEIYLDNENISHLTESELAQVRGKKIGFIFQQFNLISNLTAKENVMLPMLFQETPKEQREEEAENLLGLVDLKDRMDHYPNQLSGGQQQRVAIARALANNPEVVLADEPTGNLDSSTGERVLDFLEKLHKQGTTIVMVTHDPNIAKNHAKTIYSIKDGKIEGVSKNINGKWVKHSVN